MSKQSVIIVESPSKAKTIQNYLGNNYKAIACNGHIKDLPKKELGVDIDKDFSINEVKLSDKKDFFKELKKFTKEYEKIIIATDPDREGEAIAAHIAQEIDESKISRVRFTEITKDGIIKEMKKPESINFDLVEARQARRIIDRLVGYKVSRVLWSTLRKNMKFVDVSLSAGRVQSAALRIMVERERLRQSFKSATYYDLKAEFQKDKIKFNSILFQIDKTKIAQSKDFDDNTGELINNKVIFITQNEAINLIEKTKDNNWIVDNVVVKQRNSNPKPPFTTSTLQQEAARKLKFSARNTMRVAQKLYEQGFITYMRTDSTNLSVEGLKGSRSEILKKFGKEFLPEKPNIYVTKVKNAQEAHEAIRPAGVKFSDANEVKNKIGSDAEKLFELIKKRTIASQMKPAILNQTSAVIKNDNLYFKSTGQVIIFKGYMAAYIESLDESKTSEENNLPNLIEGEKLNINKINLEKHDTKPPPRFTEASLVKELESKGIGRPSTFANIIDNIVYRTYVDRNKGKLTPTFLGIAVTQLLENHFNSLVDSQFTAKMEDNLDAISRGELKSIPFMKDFYFGSASQTGLSKMLDDKVDIAKACTVNINYDEKNKIELRVGQFGPFLQKGDLRKSVPFEIYLGDLNINKADEILNNELNDNKEIGKDANGEMIYLKIGPYGPYLEKSETKTRKSIPKGFPISEVDLEYAFQLFSLPKVLGKHPESNENITSDYGRFGPYVSAGKGKNASIPANLSPLTITLDEALDLISKKTSTSKDIRTLGVHPKSNKTITVKEGRYGPYLTDGKINVSIPKNFDKETISLDDSIILIDKKIKSPKKKLKKKKR